MKSSQHAPKLLLRIFRTVMQDISKTSTFRLGVCETAKQNHIRHQILISHLPDINVGIKKTPSLMLVMLVTFVKTFKTFEQGFFFLMTSNFIVISPGLPKRRQGNITFVAESLEH